jgi:hypothetical protein
VKSVVRKCMLAVHGELDDGPCCSSILLHTV